MKFYLSLNPAQVCVTDHRWLAQWHRKWIDSLLDHLYPLILFSECLLAALGIRIRALSVVYIHRSQVLCDINKYPFRMSDRLEGQKIAIVRFFSHLYLRC